MEKNNQLALGKINFILIAVSFAIIVLGFVLMTGKPTIVDFEPDIFSNRRIVVGPMIALFGFVAMIFAILYKPKSK